MMNDTDADFEKWFANKLLASKGDDDTTRALHNSYSAYRVGWRAAVELERKLKEN